MSLCFVPHGLHGVLRAAGLPAAQRLAAVVMLTLPEERPSHIRIDTQRVADLAGVDRHVVSRAKAKLRDACLIELVEPRKEIGPAMWTPELWDFGALYEALDGAAPSTAQEVAS